MSPNSTVRKTQQTSVILIKNLKDVNAEADKMNLFRKLEEVEPAEFNEGYGDAIIGIPDKNVLTNKLILIDYKTSIIKMDYFVPWI